MAYLPVSNVSLDVCPLAPMPVPQRVIRRLGLLCGCRRFKNGGRKRQVDTAERWEAKVSRSLCAIILNVSALMRHIYVHIHTCKEKRGSFKRKKAQKKRKKAQKNPGPAGQFSRGKKVAPPRLCPAKMRGGSDRPPSP